MWFIPIVRTSHPTDPSLMIYVSSLQVIVGRETSGQSSLAIWVILPHGYQSVWLCSWVSQNATICMSTVVQGEGPEIAKLIFDWLIGFMGDII